MRNRENVAETLIDGWMNEWTHPVAFSTVIKIALLAVCCWLFVLMVAVEVAILSFYWYWLWNFMTLLYTTCIVQSERKEGKPEDVNEEASMHFSSTYAKCIWHLITFIAIQYSTCTLTTAQPKQWQKPAAKAGKRDTYEYFLHFNWPLDDLFYFILFSNPNNLEFFLFKF